MSISPDDPRLTVYALGELSELKTEEIAAIEEAIASDPLVAAEIDALQATAQFMQESFAAQPAAHLPQKQKSTVIKSCSPRPIPLLAILGSLAAAGLVATISVAMLGTGGTSYDESPPLSHVHIDPPSELNDATHERRDLKSTEEQVDRENGEDDLSYLNPLGGRPVVLNEIQSHTEKSPSANEDRDQVIVSGLAVGEFTVDQIEEDWVVVEEMPKGRQEAVSRSEAGGTLAYMPVDEGRPVLGDNGNRIENVERKFKNKYEKKRQSFIMGGSDGGGVYIFGAKEAVQVEPVESDNYNSINERGFRSLNIAGNDFSTFSIDVDTASYSDVRSHLTQHNRLPQAQAIRIEEMINYFDYAYEGPSADAEDPFRYHVESSVCPWNTQNSLMRIGIQAKRIAKEDRPATNLVFLIDASGSMGSHNKMPLLKNAFKMLVKQLDERDNVAIVAYAGASGLVLPITNGTENHKILNALDRLRSGGSTNGAGGIQQAYAVAQQMFNKDAENRVILATDGDFNVGISDQDSLIALIKEKAQHGIFLNIHGYGMGNRKDGTMELMSNNGNGTYAYIDNNLEAQKVMVDDLTGSLVTVAKDVKIQCVFNPQHVAAWRLIGYENRVLAKEDFKDDKKDAGEIGAGHNVTALYEIVPRGVKVPGPDVDPNPFIKNPEPKEEQAEPVGEISPAWLQLRLRYKQPQGTVSTPMLEDIVIHEKNFASASEGFRWAASVASFGMLLSKSPNAGSTSWDSVIKMAKQSRGADEKGLRAECIRLMEMARNMQ